jgi:hypothetical protein
LEVTVLFAHKDRNIVIIQLIDPSPEKAETGGKTMEFLIPLGILLAWIILQAWVLPRLGVKT